jgi:hypothetical protein
LSRPAYRKVAPKNRRTGRSAIAGTLAFVTESQGCPEDDKRLRPTGALADGVRAIVAP